MGERQAIPASGNIYCLGQGSPEKQNQSEAEKFQDLQLASWSPRRANDVSPTLSPSVKAGEDQCPSSKTVRQRETERAKPHLLSLFVLFRPSTDWMGPTHIGKDNLLSSA